MSSDRSIPVAHSRSRECLVLALLLAAGLVAAFPGVFRGEMLSPASMLYDKAPWAAYAPPGWTGSPNHFLFDIMNQDRPWYFLTRQALDAGEWPLWNPYWAFGVPLLGNGQTAVFYPPRLLHAFLDIDVATTLLILFRIAACGIAAYLCGRGMGLRISVCRFLCVAWMLASYNRIYCSWPLSDASTWFPLMLLGTEYIAGNRLRRGFWTLTLSCTLCILAGHPETTFVGGFALGLYLLLRLLCSWQMRHFVVAIGIFTLAWLAATLVSAGHLAPFAEYLANGFSPLLEFQQQVRRTFTPCAVPLFWIQRFCGAAQDSNYWGDSNSIFFNALYPGVAVTVLLAMLLCRPDKKNRDGLHRLRPLCLSLAAGVSLLLAFDVPVLRNLGSLPGFHLILIHHYAIFPIFAITVLAALGLERWTGRPRAIRELAWCLIPLVLGMAAACMVFFFWRGQIHSAHQEGYILGQTSIAVGLFAAVVVVLAMHPWGLRPNWVIGLVTLLLAVDLLYANRGFNPTIQKERIAPDTALTRYLQSRPDTGRIGGTSDLGIPDGLMACYGLSCVDAFDAVVPARFLRLAKMAAGKEFNVRPFTTFVLRNPQIPPESTDTYNGLDHVTTLDGIEVYRNPNAVPRVLLAGSIEVFQKAEDLAGRFLQMTPDDMHNVILTEQPPVGPLPNLRGQSAGEARIVSNTSTRIEIEAQALIPAALMLCDTYYPGWRAEVDGQPTKIFPADYLFRGVLLGPGNHRVIFEFVPWSFRIGMAVSILALGLLIFAAARQLRIT